MTSLYITTNEKIGDIPRILDTSDVSWKKPNRSGFALLFKEFAKIDKS